MDVQAVFMIVVVGLGGDVENSWARNAAAERIFLPWS